MTSSRSWKVAERQTDTLTLTAAGLDEILDAASIGRSSLTSLGEHHREHLSPELLPGYCSVVGNRVQLGDGDRCRSQEPSGQDGISNHPGIESAKELALIGKVQGDDIVDEIRVSHGLTMTRPGPRWNPSAVICGRRMSCPQMSHQAEVAPPARMRLLRSASRVTRSENIAS